LISGGIFDHVKVLSFPPYMIHVLKTIDVGCIRTFKEALRKEVSSFIPRAELPRAVGEPATR
jgi:hypothetical protein